MVKRKKTNSIMDASDSYSFEASTSLTNLELDIRALRAKNGKLVQTVAKLQQEKAQQQAQITQLQEDYFKLNSTFVNMKSVLSTIDGTTKTILPRFVQISEMFSKIMQLCSVGNTVSVNKDSRTQAVQPHTVNGHVLQHPTISLSRLSNSTVGTAPVRSSIRNSLNQEQINGQRSENAVSPNNGRSIGETNVNGSSDQSEYDMNVERFVYRRRRNVPIGSLNMDEIRNQVDEEVDTEDDLNNGEEFCSRLFTIQEEDENNYSSPNSPRSRIIREVRIYIDRLPSDYVRRRVPRLLSSSHNSTTNASLFSSPDTTRRRSGNNPRLSNSALIPSENRRSIERNSDGIVRRSNDSLQNTSEQSSNLLKDTLTKNATVIRQETVYRTTSPFKRREARFFGEPSGYLRTTNYESVSTMRSDTNLEMSNNISAIHNVPSCSVSHVADDFEQGCITCSSTTCEKKVLLDNLGLEPFVPHITTSTPVINASPITRSHRAGNDVSVTENGTPIKRKKVSLSKVNKKRGGSSSKNKIVHVLLNRLSIEKRSMGSPIKKNNSVLDPLITKVSQIKKRKTKFDLDSSSDSSTDGVRRAKNPVGSANGKTTSKTMDYHSPNSQTSLFVNFNRMKTKKSNYFPDTSSSSSSSNNSHSDDSDIKENVDTSNRNNNMGISKNVDASSLTNTTSNSSKTVNGKPITKGAKRFLSSPSQKFKLSPRPKRAVRPLTLKEPKLNRKMRRSK